MYGVETLKCMAGLLMSAFGPPLGSLRWSPSYFLYVSTCTHTFPEQTMAAKKSFIFEMHTDTLNPTFFTYRTKDGKNYHNC